MKTIYTIGFTKKSAETFFELLRSSGARHLVDVRLHNNSQLAAFTKRDDLRYFLDRLLGMQYHEAPLFAPDEAILAEYRATKDWSRYETAYLRLIGERQAEDSIAPHILEEGAVLLCSEAEPSHCHRRLAAEYLVQHLDSLAEVKHL